MNNMEYTKFDLEQHYEKLKIKRDSLLTSRVILLEDEYVRDRGNLSDAIYEIILEIEKDMLKLEIEMLIFDIQNDSDENMKKYIKTLRTVIDTI